MIQIELNTTVAMTDGEVLALGIALEPYAAAVNYGYADGNLYVSATVEQMVGFLAFDKQVSGLLKGKTTSMAYTYTVIVPAGA